MPAIPKVNPDKVHELVSRDDALLVCAYADDRRCERIRLENAMTLSEFRSLKPDLSKDRAIIFY